MHTLSRIRLAVRRCPRVASRPPGATALLSAVLLAVGLVGCGVLPYYTRANKETTVVL